MRIVTVPQKQIKIYKFEELSLEAQEKALTANRYQEVLDGGWDEYTLETAIEFGALFGLDIDRIYFSGFSSQGDGACFEGTFKYKEGGLEAIKKERLMDEDLHQIVALYEEEQRKCGYGIEGEVKHSGHYSHSGCTFIDYSIDHGDDDDDDEEEDYACDYACDIEQPLREFMDWIYWQLEREYGYLTSDEYIVKRLEELGIEFTEDGEEW